MNSLRSLRDQFKGQLCYVVFTRHPLARLRDPGEIDEFFEIVAANTCWVGLMNEWDARWIARQMAERLKATYSEAEVAQLIEVTGGLPAFMKLGCLALAEGALDKGGSVQSWAEQLLTRLEFQRNCEEIWNDLLPEEQIGGAWRWQICNSFVGLRLQDNVAFQTQREWKRALDDQH